MLIELKEWSEYHAGPDSPATMARLTRRASEKAAVAEMTETGRLLFIEEKGGVTLRSGSFFGGVELGGINIRVRPPMEVYGLFRLFRFAYGLRRLKKPPIIPEDGSEPGMADLLIDQLVGEIEDMATRGLHRDYTEKREILICPRGRIDFLGSYKQVSIGKILFPCVHYPRTEDCLLNQAILGGIFFAAGRTEQYELKSRLRRIGKQFKEHVTRLPLDWNTLQYARNSMDRRMISYRTCITILELLMKAHSIGCDERLAGAALPGFFFDVSDFTRRFFAQFIGEYLEDYVVHDDPAWLDRLPKDGRRLQNAFPGRLDVKKDERVIMNVLVYSRDLMTQPGGSDALDRDVLRLAFGGMPGEPVIMYPTYGGKMNESFIDIDMGTRSAMTVRLQPVALVKTEALLSAKDTTEVYARRNDYAKELVFGKG